MNADIFPIVFIALYVGHSVGDHWMQTGWQSAHKHQKDKEGRTACLRHVTTVTATKLVLLLPVLAATEWPSLPWLCAGIALDAGSHYWADRRFTLEWLANKINKMGFYQLGTDSLHRDAPDGSHMGTGKYALDQAFHHLFLFVSAVLISL